VTPKSPADTFGRAFFPQPIDAIDLTPPPPSSGAPSFVGYQGAVIDTHIPIEYKRDTAAMKLPTIIRSPDNLSVTGEMDATDRSFGRSF
jgi:hypothetical protein